MTLNYQNVERDGMTTIIKWAKALCKIVSAVKHIIAGKFPDSEAIILLIEAIEALCPLISAAELEAINYGGSNDIPLDDPDSIPGINEGLPPAVPPDIA